jgi:hypothetical protein
MVFKGFGQSYQGNAMFAALAGGVQVRAEATPAVNRSLLWIEFLIGLMLIWVLALLLWLGWDWI